jgi:hypothetical protein
MKRKKSSPQSVNIRPGVSILSVLRHLNYRPWFALAEFVDNSLQSYIDNEDALKKVEGEDFRLVVTIEIDITDKGRIVVRDNAAGIHNNDYARAFRPAEIPPDTAGLSEFGMGMKSAACWFAPQWTVRTTALGERVERAISFDIERIVQDNLEELRVESEETTANTHFTEITLDNLHKMPQGRTVNKIREHLGSIYRTFIRDGVLELRFDDEVLTYTEPKVLKAPFYKTPAARAKTWRKEIDFDFGLGQRAHGFAALRETGSVSGAGFALLRRGRLIQGSADEGYRPEYIFGKSNSFTYQRLFGELQLEGFEVSHTKDGFRWDENEEVFLEFLKDELNEGPLPLLDQAEGYRARPKPEELKRGAIVAAGRTADTIEREVTPVLNEQLSTPPDNQGLPAGLPVAVKASTREIPLDLREGRWLITLELTDDPSIGDWVSISDRPAQSDKSGVRRLGVRLSLAHPFMQRFGGVEPSRIEPLLRVAVAICLSEIAARESGIKGAGTIKRNINQLLRTALAQP